MGEFLGNFGFLIVLLVALGLWATFHRSSFTTVFGAILQIAGILLAMGLIVILVCWGLDHYKMLPGAKAGFKSLWSGWSIPFVRSEPTVLEAIKKSREEKEEARRAEASAQDLASKAQALLDEEKRNLALHHGVGDPFNVLRLMIEDRTPNTQDLYDVKIADSLGREEVIAIPDGVVWVRDNRVNGMMYTITAKSQTTSKSKVTSYGQTAGSNDVTVNMQ